MENRKKNIIYVIFFVLALAILLYADFGTLTIPGIFAAVAGIWFAWKKKFIFSAGVGIIAAVGSFIGQSITAFCLYCTTAAVCFLVAGLINLFQTKKTKFNFIMLSILIVGTMIFAFSMMPADERNPVIASSNQQISYSAAVPEKPLLFLTPDCPSCKKMMKEFIAQDPQGKNWQPVIIPHSSLQRGQAILEEAGYKGDVISSSQPPCQVVPSLFYKDHIYTGKDLRKYIEGGIGHSPLNGKD